MPLKLSTYPENVLISPGSWTEHVTVAGVHELPSPKQTPHWSTTGSMSTTPSSMHLERYVVTTWHVPATEMVLEEEPAAAASSSWPASRHAVKKGPGSTTSKHAASGPFSSRNGRQSTGGGPGGSTIGVSVVGMAVLVPLLLWRFSARLRVSHASIIIAAALMSPVAHTSFTQSSTMSHSAASAHAVVAASSSSLVSHSSDGVYPSGGLLYVSHVLGGSYHMIESWRRTLS